MHLWIADVQWCMHLGMMFCNQSNYAFMDCRYACMHVGMICSSYSEYAFMDCTYACMLVWYVLLIANMHLCIADICTVQMYMYVHMTFFNQSEYAFTDCGCACVWRSWPLVSPFTSNPFTGWLSHGVQTGQGHAHWLLGRGVAVIHAHRNLEGGGVAHIAWYRGKGYTAYES